MPRLFQLLFISAFQLFSFPAFTAVAQASSLEQLQASFMGRYDEANAERDENLKKLEASYLGALKRHMDKVQASGNLERVIPFRDEIRAVEAGVYPLPALGEKVEPDLRSFREKYLDARGKVLTGHAETLVGLSGKMQQALRGEEARLTKAGKIDEALAAKRMRETLADDAGIEAARDRLDEHRAKSAPPGGWKNLLEEPFEVTSKGLWTPSVLGLGEEDLKVFGPLETALRKDGLENGEALLSHAPGIVQFQLREHARDLRAKAVLHGGGKVLMKVLAGGKTVFEEELKGGGSVDVVAEFPPTKRIVLEVDALGDQTQDWAAWVKPEVR